MKVTISHNLPNKIVVKKEFGKDCNFRITLRFMPLGIYFNEKINQFAYLKNSKGDLKVINKFYT